MSGCGCSENITGNPDATDTTSEADGDISGDLDCGDCNDHDPCTVDSCDSLTGECVHDPLDADGDGFPAMVAPDGTICDGTDCDDTDESVYPGAPEVCMDGVDQDCDTIIDGPRAMHSTVHLKMLDEHGIGPDMIWTGSEFLTVWTEGYGRQLNTARVGLDGELVGDLITLVDAVGMGIQIDYPSLEWTGSELGVAYAAGDQLTSPGESEQWDVFMLRASPTGEVLYESPRLNDVDTMAWHPTMAWTGSQYGVAWRDGRDDTCAGWDTCLYEIYFNRLEASGTEVGTEYPITDASGSAYNPFNATVWTGSEYVVVWADFESTPYVHTVSRLDADGLNVGTDVDVPHPGSAYTWTGSEIGALWQSDASGNHEIYLVRIDPLDGELGEPVRITDAPLFSGYGDIIWTGSDYAVVWLDGRDTGCSDPPRDVGDCDFDLYFNILEPEGTKLWDDVKITVRERWVNRPTLAWTGSEFGLSWWEYWEEDEDWHAAVSFDVISFCD